MRLVSCVRTEKGSLPAHRPRADGPTRLCVAPCRCSFSQAEGAETKRRFGGTGCVGYYPPLPERSCPAALLGTPHHRAHANLTSPVSLSAAPSGSVCASAVTLRVPLGVSLTEASPSCLSFSLRARIDWCRSSRRVLKHVSVVSPSAAHLCLNRRRPHYHQRGPGQGMRGRLHVSTGSAAAVLQPRRSPQLRRRLRRLGRAPAFGPRAVSAEWGAVAHGRGGGPCRDCGSAFPI